MNDEENRYERLARYLCAAYAADHAGIGLDYAYRTYVKDLKIGPLWLQLAELVQKRLALQIGAEIHIPEPPAKVQ